MDNYKIIDLCSVQDNRDREALGNPGEQGGALKPPRAGK